MSIEIVKNGFVYNIDEMIDDIRKIDADEFNPESFNKVMEAVNVLEGEGTDIVDWGNVADYVWDIYMEKYLGFSKAVEKPKYVSHVVQDYDVLPF